MYKKNFLGISILFCLVIIMILSCVTDKSATEEKKQYVLETEVEHPEWIKDAVIYEVNLRQYSELGDINSFAEHMPRLKELGVDILWLMPIHPIGELNRKGELGSYYSIKDYTALNPEFGTIDDFKRFVDKAHELNMFVILDWVANHTAWDHSWVSDNPDWYQKDSLGKMFSPYDWTDVAQLDYDNKDMRESMKDAMLYWVEETNIDGYRCDVAGLVPCDFWQDVHSSLDSIRDVFMLAEDEAEYCLLEKAFDMNYAWELHHIFNEIAQERQSASDLSAYFNRYDSIYGPDVIKMNFITNHDENSWNGTVSERLGDASETFAMLTFTLPGMPLIYSGQEIGLEKRLEFFKKDPISWKESDWEDIYKKLIDLKTENPALWNGKEGGSMEILNVENPESIFAFKRVHKDNEVLVLANLSGDDQTVDTNFFTTEGNYKDIDTTDYMGASLNIPAYKYKIFTK